MPKEASPADGVFNAVLPVVLAHYGQDGWTADFTTVVAPDGRKVSTLPAHQTKELFRFMRQGSGRWVPEVIVTWTIRAVIVMLESADPSSVKPETWQMTGRQEVTVTSQNGTLIAEGLPQGAVGTFYDMARTATLQYRQFRPLSEG